MLCKIKAGERFRLNKHFTAYLTRKLNINGINCALNCDFNWLKKENCRKRCSPYWRGVYICKEKKCSIKYNFSVEDSDSTILRMQCDDSCDH